MMPEEGDVFWRNMSKNLRISLFSRAFSGFRGWADDGEEEGDEVHHQIWYIVILCQLFFLLSVIYIPN